MTASRKIIVVYFNLCKKNMSYDEQRMSDQIDGGLLQQKREYIKQREADFEIIYFNEIGMCGYTMWRIFNRKSNTKHQNLI